MAKTLSRDYCSPCQSKDNLCTFETDDKVILRQCKTPSCINSNAVRIDDYGYNRLSPNDSMEEKHFVVLENVSVLSSPVKQEKEYRGISAEICNKLRIREGKAEEGFLTEYLHENLDFSVDIKYRWPEKKFSWAKPKSNNTTLFALDKCTDFTKPLIITEGNEDAASFWEIGYQACSLLSGTDYGDSLRLSLEYINNFSSIILAIENDLVGNTVKEYIKDLFKHKQLFEIDFSPHKDANEILQKDSNLLKSKLETKREILPIGLISGDQLDFSALKNQIVRSIPLPWPGLNAGMNELEYGCLYLFLAGTGTGKSTVLRELAYWYRKTLPDLKIANFFFEENEKVTPLAYMALELNVPLGTLRRQINDLSEEDFTRAKKIVDSDKLTFINKDLSKDVETLLARIEYLVSVRRFDLIIIDHISYIIARSGIGKHGERRDIDEFIYKLQDLVQRLGCIIVAVSHINESDSKKRWDQGEVPNIYSGRGSKALAHVPDGIIGLSRAISNEYEKSVLSLYNLKNRWHANTGKTDELVYIDKTGRLVIK